MLPEKTSVPQLVKRSHTFYGTRRFITAFTGAHHMSLFWASSVQSLVLHPTSWRFILILSSHLLLVLPRGLFTSSLPTKTMYAPLVSPLHATCPAHLIPLDLITQIMIGEQYRSLSSSLCSFFHSTATSSLTGPNILLSTLKKSSQLSVRKLRYYQMKTSHAVAGDILVAFDI